MYFFRQAYHHLMGGLQFCPSRGKSEVLDRTKLRLHEQNGCHSNYEEVETNDEVPFDLAVLDLGFG